MKLTRYDDATPFYDRAEAFLLAHEAEHCLMLGLRATLIQQPDYFGAPPYLALVEEDAEIVAAALRTPKYNLALSLMPNEKLIGASLTLLVEDVRAVYPTLPGVIGPAALSRAFAGEWQRTTGQTYQAGTKERIYRLDTVIPVRNVLGTLRSATENDRTLLVRWLDAFRREALGPDTPLDAERWMEEMQRSSVRAAYLWEDSSAPVSLVGHTGPTPHGMRIGPVYTPPELRGHGYASAATAAVSQMLLDSGRQFCFLFTDLSNPTSNSIYQKIGYQPMVDVDVYKFQHD
ncbi:MAG: GNAT family N-acetyltransferase [Ktedonobacterales bacterium]